MGINFDIRLEFVSEATLLKLQVGLPVKCTEWTDNLLIAFKPVI